MTRETYRSTEESSVPRSDSLVLKARYEDIEKLQGLVATLTTVASRVTSQSQATDSESESDGSQGLTPFVRLQSLLLSYPQNQLYPFHPSLHRRA